MNIKKVRWKNFRSYSNIWTEINFDEPCSFIGIYGDSGAGKTTICDVIDFCLFKKVRGKRRTWTVLNTLPNRYNKGLECEIEFEKEGDIYTIKRGLNPSFFIFLKNGQEPQGGKNTHEKMLEDVLKIDIDTFKTFVSVDTSDFINFAALKADDKRKLMDRLLSLDTITELYKISHILSVKSNETANEEKNAYESLLKLSEKLKQDEQNDNEEKIKLIENEINKIKEEGKKLNEEKKEIEQKYEEYRKKSNEIESSLFELKSNAIKQKSKIDEYVSMLKRLEMDYCPHCLQKITEEHKQTIGERLIIEGKEKRKKIKKLETEIQEKENVLEEIKIKINSFLEKKQNIEVTINSLLRRYRDLEKEIEKNETKKNRWEEAYKSAEEKHHSYEYHKNESKMWQLMKQIFSEEGLKKDIIEGIIVPVNERLNEYLPKLNLRFSSKINSSFEIFVFEGNEEIDVDTLSRGEEARLNLALMMSFLNIVHEKVKVNMLLLDEVFKPMDIPTAEMCMNFIKEWAKQNNINVLATHHSELNKKYFDRVFFVERKIFSTLIEKK